jgi:hypothetical protein
MGDVRTLRRSGASRVRRAPRVATCMTGSAESIVRPSPLLTAHGALGFIRCSQILIGKGNLEGGPVSLRDSEAGQTLHIRFSELRRTDLPVLFSIISSPFVSS